MGIVNSTSTSAIAEANILDGFKKNNIIDFYDNGAYHYFIKNNSINKFNHIIGKEFILSSDLIDLVCKIINENKNYNNTWFLLPYEFHVTIFSGVVEINYDKFIIILTKTETLNFKVNIYDRSYKKVSKDDFILYKENNIKLDKKIKLDKDVKSDKKIKLD